MKEAREAFESWVLDGLPEVDTGAELLTSVAGCSDVMPRAICEELDLEQGTSYGEAAQVVKGRPDLPLRLAPIRR